MLVSHLRTIGGLAVAFGVAWLGSRILGEYPFTGIVPVLGGLLLGVAIVGAAAFVEKTDPPPWAVVLAAGFAAWAMWEAAHIDAGTGGSLSWEAYAAMGAGAVGALARLVPRPVRRREPSRASAETEAQPDQEND